MATMPVNRWFFKACPRCAGDLFAEAGEAEATCVQCGGDTPLSMAIATAAKHEAA